jgi:hypothetical protein
MVKFKHCISILVVFKTVILLPFQSSGIWVVNFGTASTLKPKTIGFAAGMGGQMVFVGSPRTTNAFYTIPHAGFRYGIANNIDIGLRLAPVPLPFSTVGPGFGINIDAKFHIGKKEDKVQFALVAGLGGAHVLIRDEHRLAWSPNGAALTTFRLNEKTQLTLMGRYVHLEIPTAKEGAVGNFVNISGVSAGLKRTITPSISILPEVGVYWYEGAIARIRTSGPGFQYGLMLAATF